MIVQSLQQPKRIPTADENHFRFIDSSRHVGNIMD
jgi:hypothetical protein